MSYTTLIDSKVLARHLYDESWVVFDCRYDLAYPLQGKKAYLRSHIPGAFFLDLRDDLSGPCLGHNGRHPLPDATLLAEKLGECGVSHKTQVVAYDDAGGMFAARLWWLLRWLGHKPVAVLDGGFQRWWRLVGLQSADMPPVRKVAHQFAASNGWVDMETVRSNLDDPQLLLVDARSPDRFQGENEVLDPVGGRIPGAVNRFFRDNLVNKTQCFKSPVMLRREFMTVLNGWEPRQVVHQCGSGVTACHNLLAMEVAGLSGSRLYPGSWSEWCADASRPIATGAV